MNSNPKQLKYRGIIRRPQGEMYRAQLRLYGDDGFPLPVYLDIKGKLAGELDNSTITISVVPECQPVRPTQEPT